jgi:hypothetical protein
MSGIATGISQRNDMKSSFVNVVSIVALVSASPEIGSAQQTESAKLLASDGNSHDHFGTAVSISGNRAVIGAGGDEDPISGGSAYVFERDASGVWQEVAKLVGSSPTVADCFGCAAEVFGDRLIVGAREHGASDRGSAYILERDVQGAWIEVAHLQASDGGPNDHFGHSVSLFGDRAVVGALNYDLPSEADAGAVYVFERNASGSWVEVAILTGSETTSNTYQFGTDVSLYGARLAVATRLGNAVYLFERTGGGIWVEAAVFSSLQYPLGDCLSLVGDRLLVGAPWFDHDGIPYAGMASIFERSGGGTWMQTATLVASDAQADDQFGLSVALSPSRALVTAARDDPTGSVYEYELTSSGTWIETTRFAPSVPVASGLTRASAVSPDVVIASSHEDDDLGTFSGSALVFDVALGDLFCESTVNSTGTQAVLSCVGSASVAINQLSLHAAPVPVTASGIFFFGPIQVNQAFGNGIRCVGGSIVRLAPGIAQNHVLDQTLDLAAPPLVGNLVPGSTWHVQAWFRDPPAGGANFNTSSARSILFEP